MNETLAGYGAIIFGIGCLVGMSIYRLMLHLEGLDWVRTRVYYNGFQEGYKKGFRDGKKSKEG